MATDVIGSLLTEAKDMLPNVATTATGIGTYLLGRKTAKEDAARQQEYNMELMAKQNEYNTASQQRQYELEKAMFAATGYEAKVAQMKNAGLNPALIYGGGGAGVTGNISAPSVSGQSAPNTAQGTANAINMASVIMELRKTKSEIAVNESIAEANKANATLQTSKTGTESLIQKTESLRQIGIGLNNELKTIEVNVQGSSKNDKILAISAAADKAVAEAKAAFGTMQSALAKGSIDVKTQDEQIQLVNLSIAKAYTEMAALKSNNQLNDAKREAIANEITQAWTRLEYDTQKISAETKRIWNEYFNNDMSKSDVMFQEMITKLVPSIIIPIK